MSLVEKKYKLTCFVANQKLIQDNEKTGIVMYKKKDPIMINFPAVNLVLHKGTRQIMEMPNKRKIGYVLPTDRFSLI